MTGKQSGRFPPSFGHDVREGTFANAEGPPTRGYGGWPLQHAQIDLSELDIWLNICDIDGSVEERKRPWLVSIVDVYSRMVLSAVPLFENPSTDTITMATRADAQAQKIVGSRDLDMQNRRPTVREV